MTLKTKKIISTVLAILIGTLVLAILGFVIWAENPIKSELSAQEALRSDTKVTVTSTHGWMEFSPAGVQPFTGFVFYPGARVDPRAYAPVMRQIAERGYLAVIVPVRLNLALFDINAAAPVLAAYPEITHWAVGGHSLGGVAATIFATKHIDVVGGIALWASYPVDASLVKSAISIVSISGTRDGLATPEKITASRSLLPPSTVWVHIVGGNHAGFGAYGPQPGDNSATISSVDQWKQTAEATVEMLTLAGQN